MIYLDNAATSFPKPVAVGEEVKKCIDHYAGNPGRGSYEIANLAGDKVSECRELISELFNINSPMNVVFTTNATEGLNEAIIGILRSGDHVITTALEHNSVLRPLKYLESKGVETTIVPINHEGELNLVDIKSSLKKSTKMIIINHVSNVLGTIQNIHSIGELCKEKGLIFMVDASQSAGKLNIDVKKNSINILAFPGHKGLLGPQGVGGLYIDPKIQDEIRPIKFGGTGSKSLDLNQPSFFPDILESGTMNVPSIAGLCEGIKFLKNEGIEKIYKKEEKLMHYLIEELNKLHYVKIYGKLKAPRAGVLSINIDYLDPSDVGYFLNKRGIAVRTGFHCAGMIHKYLKTERMGTVRISPGYFNDFKEIEKVVEAIKDIYEEEFTS
ncbi:aminotransferase class V-fold PLP-dependent enzyme [Hathewaya limosa]|uniref:cysteine desulfurase n=1 Tax=Hathewaya limosa TaxID=1536 RepID=A0ABU0JT96_HATLI|nr:aminotransferase class V-fold PLP-dependent enzyme [Hathewaya limosa]MDQ0479456.1 cysteine desulfurase family protein [Hathewaya limosa]